MANDTFFDGIGYNYEMLNEAKQRNSKAMTVDTHFRKKPKRLPSYIKLEKTIETDETSEDSTSTADSSESGISLSCNPKTSKLTKLPTKIVANCLRKVAKSVCGAEADDRSHDSYNQASQACGNNSKTSEEAATGV